MKAPIPPNWVLSDPGNFAECGFEIKFWSQLRDFMTLFACSPRMVIIGANAVGKSYAIAACALWYFILHRFAIIIITSPSWGQLQRGLWRYISGFSRLASFAKLASYYDTQIEITQNIIRKKGVDSFIWAVSTNTRERLQGIHGDKVLVIVDEGSGVPGWIPEVIVSLGAEKVVYSGNPLDPRGPLWEAWNSALYKRMSISALEHPNVVENKIIYPGGVSRNMVDEIRDKYGEDSPIYVARVLGQFPEDAESILIPRGLIGIAQNRSKEDGITVLGLDVARGGGDLTAIATIKGNTASVETWNEKDLMVITGKTIERYKTTGANIIVVDETGLGAGVVDRLREQGIPVLGINFSATAEMSDRYSNRRAELWWTMREALQDWLYIPEDRALEDDLNSLRFEYDSRGRIKLQSKSELSSSPDRGDALALAVWGARRGNINYTKIAEEWNELLGW